MSFKRKLMNLTLIGSVAISLCLTGCGKRTMAEAPVDPAAETPAATEPATTEPEPAPVPSTPAYEQPPVAAGSLVVSGITKDKVGIIGFRKVKVKGQVVNTGTTPLSGEVKIEFKKKKGIINKTLETSETKNQVVAQVAPGASVSFEITSDKSCDDAEVIVTTTAPAASTAAYGYTGSAYGQPYGQQQPASPYGR